MAVFFFCKVGFAKIISNFFFLGEEVSDSVSNQQMDKNSFQLRTIDESFSQNEEKFKEESPKLKELDWNKQSFTTHTPKRQRSGLNSLELKRRNSDPATKTLGVLDNPEGSPTPPSGDDLQWQTHTTFTMAGHVFRKCKGFSKDDVCAFCKEQMDAFITQGHKCNVCKKIFHTKCIQNRNVLRMPCDVKASGSLDSAKPGRRKTRKHSKTPYDLKAQSVSTNKFSLTKTSEFTDRADQIISDTKELQQMQTFITSKICKIDTDAAGKPSEVDRLFKHALREFKDNLVQVYSAANRNSEAYSIKYKDLIMNFMQAMETVCQKEQTDKDFPVTMGVNAFRGFMDEFMTSRPEAEKPNKIKRKKDKKRKLDDLVEHAGHTFLLTIINIPTACEICNSFFMWPIERGLICQNCKVTCHKKCYLKTGICTKGMNTDGGNKLFGVPLVLLIKDESTIPVVIERLLATIELRGLYIEG